MMSKIKIGDIVGSGPLGFGLCVVVFVTFWQLDRVTGIAPLCGDEVVHWVLAGVLLCAGGMVFLAAFWAMPLSQHNKCLVRHGVYSYVRHPRYAAVVFLIYPAVGLLAHSCLCLISTVAAYVGFRFCAGLEERKLIGVFGREYKDYMEEVPGFVPRVRRRRKQGQRG